MQARIVGPEEELGDVHKGAKFFGNHLTRDWSDITVTPDQLTKLQGNRYVELRGAATKGGAAPAAPATPAAGPTSTAAEAETIRARLTELGVEVKPKAPLMALRSALAKAEKAKAAADAE